LVCFCFNPPTPFPHSTVPPKWTIEPADVDIERNRQLIIDCQADGVPKPTVVWKKATGQYLEHNINIIIAYKQYYYYILLFLSNRKSPRPYTLYCIFHLFSFSDLFPSYCFNHVIGVKPPGTHTWEITVKPKMQFSLD